MITYVLDASAILRYIDDEAGAERSRGDSQRHARPHRRRYASRLCNGARLLESYRKRLGPGKRNLGVEHQSFAKRSHKLFPLLRSGRFMRPDFRVDRNLAYADGFAMDLALDSADTSTGDRRLRIQGCGRSGQDRIPAYEIVARCATTTCPRTAPTFAQYSYRSCRQCSRPRCAPGPPSAICAW
jgi:hypothetical protein